MATPDTPVVDPHDLDKLEHNAAQDHPAASTPGENPFRWQHISAPTPYGDSDDQYNSSNTRYTGALPSDLGGKRTASATGTASGDADQHTKEAVGQNPVPAKQPTASEGAGDKTVPKKKASWFQRNKNRTITAAILGTLGISTGGGFLFFNLASQPLKLFSIMDNIQTRFEAAPMDAMQKITVNAVNHYISNPVLKSIYNGSCDDTISRDCSPVIANDNNPVTRLFAAMKKQHFENTLAKNGLEFKKDLKTGKVTMYYNGKVALQDAVLKEVANSDGSITILQVLETDDTRVLRKGITQIAKDSTESERGMNRFLIYWGLTREYGTPRCIIACNLTDTLHIKLANAKKAAVAFTAEHVINHVSPSYAQILLCVIDPTGDDCDVKLEDSTGDIRRSPFDRALGIQLRNWSEQFYKEIVLFTDPETGEVVTGTVDSVLSKVISNLGDYFEKGTSKYIADAILTPLLGEIGDKVMPVVGWVIMAAQLESTASKVGTVLKYMDYAVTAASVVNLYMEYSTVASEMKSGHTNIAALQGFYQSLGTNLNGTGKNQADATSTPLYSAMFGGGVPSESTPYRCDDGSKVPSGQLVCPEEVLDRGNDIASQISSIANFVPGLSSVADVITTISNVPGAILGGAFNTVCGAIPPCAGAVQAAGSKLADFSLWLVSKLIAMPLSGGDQGDVSGGRIFDMLAAGADVAYNEQCQQTLGCAKLTNQQIADIRNEVTAEQKAQFDSRPMFARLFSTDTPYSLVSRLAVAMPANLSTAGNDLANMIGNPFGNLASIVSRIFSGPQAFAATQPFDDPFGVTQYGFTSVPNDPQAYWDNSCQGDYKTAWFNAQQQDPNTGEPVATTPNYCMLIQAMVNSVGPQFDRTLAPEGSLADSGGSGSNSAGRDIVWLSSGCSEEFDNGSGASICADENACPDPYGLSGNCYDPVSKHSTTWISGQCSQASITEVLNAYHQRQRVESNSLVPYYRTIDVERVGYKLGTWDGAWLNAGSQAAWQKEAAAFDMDAQVTEWPKNEQSLDQIIQMANAGQPLIASAPNHYVVIWGGDSKFIYLLDSSGHDFTYAPQSTDGTLTNNGPKMNGPHTIHKATREEFLAGMGGTSEFANGYWGGETILLTPKATGLTQ